MYTFTFVYRLLRLNYQEESNNTLSCLRQVEVLGPKHSRVILHTAQFPKDHTPQVRPDHVPAIYLRFCFTLLEQTNMTKITNQ